MCRSDDWYVLVLRRRALLLVRSAQCKSPLLLLVNVFGKFLRFFLHITSGSDSNCTSDHLVMPHRFDHVPCGGYDFEGRRDGPFGCYVQPIPHYGEESLPGGLSGRGNAASICHFQITFMAVIFHEHLSILALFGIFLSVAASSLYAFAGEPGLLW